jgi:outer membrane protein TolC
MTGELNSRFLLAGILATFFTLAPPIVRAQAPASATGDAASLSYPIDLPTVLRLAQAQNIDVQIARERISEAKANHASAIAKFLPWISVGAGFHRHEGRTQAVDGALLDVDKQSTAYGPMVTAQIDIGDAIFTTLAAKQVVSATASAFIAQQQDSTLNAASDYFELLKAKGLVDVTRDALKTSEDYEHQVRRAVDAGVMFKGDELRVQTQTDRYRANLAQAQQQQRAATARLAEFLHLDPALELIPQDSELLPIALIQADSPVDLLVKQALTARADLQQSQALAVAARDAKNNTVYGPLIPTLGAQAFIGEFGGGPGYASDNFASSKDYFVGLNWRLGPGGLFDFTRINASKARLNIAELNVEKMSDGVKRQVIEGYSRLRSLSEQMKASRNSLAAATETLRLTRERKQLGVGVVLEDLQAQQELVRARADYLTAITDFNKAQYELSKAVGML